MTYNVFGRMLNLAQSKSQFIRRYHYYGNDKIITRYQLLNANEKNVLLQSLQRLGLL